MEAPLKDCTTLEQRAVIRFLSAEGIQTSQICQKMKNIYEHPAYSPDLAPSDYFLFGLLKKELKGKRFDSDEDVQKVVQDFFHTLPKSAYKKGIYKLPERWRRCIKRQINATIGILNVIREDRHLRMPVFADVLIYNSWPTLGNETVTREVVAFKDCNQSYLQCLLFLLGRKPTILPPVERPYCLLGRTWLSDFQRVARYNKWDDSMCLANVIFYLTGIGSAGSKTSRKS
ncbi:hypothetical protein LAZ67_10001210 [Cordylochernes scorpioides]|uniref:Uncharacterized protein n=1 Tax=Cordylochernes scorpioides TaxID=51811 RepID=A0ABY6KYF9_9ARAC|nr:hypothetical protein LAZ67_10001210 [Cordylochernes scorpioides]